MAIKFGNSKELVVPEDEIITRLLAVWSEAVAGKARPSPELYSQCLSDVLRGYVREKREGATAFMRRFVEKYTYDDMQPLFSADSEARNIEPPTPPADTPPPEKEPDTPAPTAIGEEPMIQIKPVSPQMLKIIRMRQRLRRRRTLGILLFLLVAALFAWSGRILDAIPKQVSLDQIPDLLQVYQSHSTPWPAGNLHLALSLWGQPRARIHVVASLHQTSASEQTWLLAFKSIECSSTLQRLEDGKAAAWALRRVAKTLKYHLASPVESRKASTVYAHYPVDMLIARARAYPVSNSTHIGWLETGMSALPEGIGAVGIITTRFSNSDTARNSLYQSPDQIVRPIQGHAFYCRQPTVWGWYMDRERYLP